MAIKSNEVHLLGDFNYWLELVNEPKRVDLVNTLAGLGFEQQIKHPTHNLGHTLNGIFV